MHQQLNIKYVVYIIYTIACIGANAQPWTKLEIIGDKTPEAGSMSAYCDNMDVFVMYGGINPLKQPSLHSDLVFLTFKGNKVELKTQEQGIVKPVQYFQGTLNVIHQTDAECHMVLVGGASGSLGNLAINADSYLLSVTKTGTDTYESTWTLLETSGIAQRTIGHASVFVFGKGLYVFGGSSADEETAFKDVRLLEFPFQTLEEMNTFIQNPTSLRWEMILRGYNTSNYPAGRIGSGLIYYPKSSDTDEYLLVLGGRQKNFVGNDSIYQLSLGARSWTRFKTELMQLDSPLLAAHSVYFDVSDSASNGVKIISFGGVFDFDDTKKLFGSSDTFGTTIRIPTDFTLRLECKENMLGWCSFNDGNTVPGPRMLHSGFVRQSKEMIIVGGCALESLTSCPLMGDVWKFDLTNEGLLYEPPEPPNDESPRNEVEAEYIYAVIISIGICVFALVLAYVYYLKGKRSPTPGIEVKNAEVVSHVDIAINGAGDDLPIASAIVE